MMSHCDLICISLMISDDQQSFIYLLAMCLSSFWKCVFGSLTCQKNQIICRKLLFVSLLSYLSSLFVLQLIHC
jgi:hypothetical protein